MARILALKENDCFTLSEITRIVSVAVDLGQIKVGFFQEANQFYRKNTADMPSGNA
jgi:hypothetical protein